MCYETFSFSEIFWNTRIAETRKSAQKLTGAKLFRWEK